MRIINLHNNGMESFVDDDVFEFINKWRWTAKKPKNAKSYYAFRGVWNKETKVQKFTSMHRIILNVTDPKIKVDHIDHNGLNNQRDNLRLATHAQNLANNSGHYNSSSKYLGVSWKSANKRWVSQITKNGLRIHIGLFKNELDAALSYNKKAIELHGEFANLNIL